MDKICFVIQPFSNPFNKRYEDTFKPAIINAGLKPYRVDKDPAVSIPIKDIETGIKKASICFADITTDNPNVWFELGFALAVDKEVCLVCSTERTMKYPFDIQHRSIITYSVESSSDFHELSKKITEKITALLNADKSLSELPVLETGIKTNDEIQPHEQAILISIMKNFYDSQGKSGYLLKEDLEKAGFNELATSLAIASLLKKQFIFTTMNTDSNGNDFMVHSLTDMGTQWINDNQKRFDLRKGLKPTKPATKDEIPF
jgi:hypothetical protein